MHIKNNIGLLEKKIILNPIITEKFQASELMLRLEGKALTRKNNATPSREGIYVDHLDCSIKISSSGNQTPDVWIGRREICIYYRWTQKV